MSLNWNEVYRPVQGDRFLDRSECRSFSRRVLQRHDAFRHHLGHRRKARLGLLVLRRHQLKKVLTIILMGLPWKNLKLSLAFSALHKFLLPLVIFKVKET